MQQNTAYQSLIQKLDQFIRKYYTNEVIRGGIFAFTYVIVFFLAINLLEYYLYLSSTLRKLLFLGFIFSSLIVLFRFVFYPILLYFKLGKTISHEQASSIIGNHFKEVSDKLLNILQLKKLETLDEYSLVNASIYQKINEMKLISFSQAVDLIQNKKYLKYLLPPAILMLGIALFSPNVFKQGTKRLYYSDLAFEKEAPFKFVVKNKSLKTLQYEAFTIEATTEGEVEPSELYIETEGNKFKMRQTEKNQYSYDFSNLQKDVKFKLFANGFYSKEYMLTVVAKPIIKGFSIYADYPAYTGKPDETLDNTGDMTVPAGTRLTWKVKTQSATSLSISFGDTAKVLSATSEGQYSFAKTFINTQAYKMKLSGDGLDDADSISYTIAVIPDLYPQIDVAEKRDSLNDRYFYYLGEISDDYGIKRLTFNYQITRAEKDDGVVSKSIDIPFQPGTSSAFQYFWNITELGISPGDKMTYYFEVWDNDGVRGSKSSKSGIKSFDMPTENELQKEFEKDSKEIKDDLQESIKDAQKLKKEMQDLQEKLLDKKNLNWDDKKKISDALEKQKQLEEQIKQLNEKFKQNLEKQDEYKKQTESIKEKQNQLKELFDAVMNDEMKKLYEKLQKMLENIQKKEAVEKMDDMKQNAEKTEKDLDRMLELYKKLELQQKTQETIDKLEKLAEKQEKLAEKSEQKNSDAKELKEKQDELNKEMDAAKKDLEDIEKLNKETESEADTKETKEEMDKAEQDMKDAEENLKKNDKSSASKNQKSAAKNMKNAAKKLAKIKADMEAEESEEDMQALRQLLKNILTISFDQEKLMKEVKNTDINNPKYPDLMKEQQRIVENSRMVEDSLYALAKRVFQIKSFVTKQMTDVNKYLDLSKKEMEERNTYKASGFQQFVMTGLNNLALMLSETQQQMQMQQSSSDPKDGTPKMCSKCKKPGDGMPKLSKMQKQLSDKISQLAEKMMKDGEGKKPGEQGDKQGQGGNNSKQYSKEFAEMAAQQAEMRRLLEQINNEENKDGKGGMGDLKKVMEQMEKNETDLVNKRLTTEMLRRQQDITVRLLEAEKAQRERDEKPERESNTGNDIERKMPPSLENYLKQQKSMVDLYKTAPPSLKPYYKQIADKYFKSISVK